MASGTLKISLDDSDAELFKLKPISIDISIQKLFLPQTYS